jgi:hypothetical protein
MYFGLGGIWDGHAGFAWCVLQAFYEYIIVLKTRELRELPPGSHIRSGSIAPPNQTTTHNSLTPSDT